MTQAHAGKDAAIREQAYLLWEQEGRPEGREMEFWTRAQVKVAESEQLKHLTKGPPKRARAADAVKSASAPKAVAAKSSKAKAEKADGKAKPKKKK